MPFTSSMISMRNWLAPTLTGPPALAFLPALTLAAFWLGGEVALMLTSLGLPLVFAVAGSFSRWPAPAALARDSVTGLVRRDGFETICDEIYREAQASGLRSASFILQLDDFVDVVDRYGPEAADFVARQTGERIHAALRDADTVARTGDDQFAICLHPVRQMDLEQCIALSGRLQCNVEEPISLDGMSVYVSASIGFCLLNRAPGASAREWIAAAHTALGEAQQNGPSSIRAYAAERSSQGNIRTDLVDHAAAALENGQVLPWFQPQISTDTGKVTGFEALARWTHPEHGMIPPAEFLPAMAQAGLMERLGQIMLYHALTALKAWDNAGMQVPRIGVNFASDELRNPTLVDKIAWELDRFDLTPDRLSVEILETVVSDRADDTITRNIRSLGAMGCGIDMDDFGTGHASIASIRRFAISRIKIDRSFVLKADQDPEQQRMIGAILTMAERLGLETLAEGVETVGEHALLAQLGCDHVQGFGIGRPMPFEQTLDWIAAHQAKLVDAPVIGRDVGKAG